MKVADCAEVNPDATAANTFDKVWSFIDVLDACIDDDDRATVSDLGAVELVREVDGLRQAAFGQGLGDVEDGAFAGADDAGRHERSVVGGELRTIGELSAVVVHDDDFGVCHVAAALAPDEEGCALFTLVEDWVVGVGVRDGGAFFVRVGEGLDGHVVDGYGGIRIAGDDEEEFIAGVFDEGHVVGQGVALLQGVVGGGGAEIVEGSAVADEGDGYDVCLAPREFGGRRVVALCALGDAVAAGQEQAGHDEEKGEGFCFHIGVLIRLIT